MKDFEYECMADAVPAVFDTGGVYRDLRGRTMEFSLRIVRMVTALPRNDVARVLGKQVLRSGTSVGAHYREACRARSDAEFISKMQGGLQELDETEYWLQLIVQSKTMEHARMADLITEANELTAIFTACVKKVKEKNQ